MVITGETAEACGLAERAFDVPVYRPQHEAELGVGELDDRKLDAVAAGRGLGGGVGVAMIDESEGDLLSVATCTSAAWALTCARSWPKAAVIHKAYTCNG